MRDDLPGQGVVRAVAGGGLDVVGGDMDVIVGLRPSPVAGREEADEVAGQQPLIGVDGRAQALPGHLVGEPFLLPHLEDGVAGLGLRFAHRPQRRHCVQGGLFPAGEVKRPQAVALQFGAFGWFIVLEEGSPVAAVRLALQPLPVDALGARQTGMGLAEIVDLRRRQPREAQPVAVVGEVGRKNVAGQFLLDPAGGGGLTGAQVVHRLPVGLALLIERHAAAVAGP